VNTATNSTNDFEQDPLIFAHKKALIDKRCGTGWQELVKNESMKAPSKDQRIYAAFAPNTGACDRTTAAITGFLAALASNRKFMLFTNDNLPQYDLAFEPESIDWTFPADRRSEVPKLGSEMEERMKSNKPLSSYSDGFFLYLIDAKNKSIIIEHMEDFMSVSALAVVNSNRGHSYGFLNKTTDSRILNFGIDPAYGFYCVFHYLFRPKADIIQLAAPMTEAITSKQKLNHTIIGIHIRYGDFNMRMEEESRHYGGTHKFNKEEVTGNTGVAAHFRCAEQIEKEHNITNAYWYLISDSHHLRVEAKNVYGDKLITDIVCWVTDYQTRKL
jgi:hypothetical protein